MMNHSHASVSNVSCIESETVKHYDHNQNATRNILETKQCNIDIKALALKALRRNIQYSNETERETNMKYHIKNSETDGKIYETKAKQYDLRSENYNRLTVKPFNTISQTLITQEIQIDTVWKEVAPHVKERMSQETIESLLYEFEERTAICMYDGTLSEIQASNVAFMEIAKKHLLNTNRDQKEKIVMQNTYE